MSFVLKCGQSVVSSSLLAISVDDPRVEGGKLNSYITYCLSVRPAMSGVSHVRRRYSDFEWLRKQLCSMFPGVFMPPLPEKKLFGVGVPVPLSRLALICMSCSLR